MKTSQAELFVAGPCFEAGRYGVAAGGLCTAVQAELGIPVVTGMALENPGVDLYRQELYIVDSGASVSAMRDVLTRMGRIATKLLGKQDIGRPVDEGYIPRGMLRDAFVEQSAAERLVAHARRQDHRRTVRVRVHLNGFPRRAGACARCGSLQGAGGHRDRWRPGAQRQSG